MIKKSPELTALVLHLYLDKKMSGVAIERQEQISRSAVYRILGDAGISPAMLRDSGERLGKQGGSLKFSTETAQQVAADYGAGLGLYALAEKYHVSVPTIRRCLKRQGQATRSRGHQRKIISDELGAAMLGDWNSGMSQHAMGIKYGMHQTTVSNILRRFDVQPEQRWLFGPQSASWKSGRVDMNGYVYMKMPKGHPFYAAMALGSGYVSEHRFVMAESLGRSLTDHETVHHIDGDRTNNTLANLQLRQGKHGTGVVYQCADCHSTNIVASVLAD